MGHAARAPCRGRRGGRRRLQGGPSPDGRSAAGAVPALPADRRGVRVPQPRVRGLGGGRRDRNVGDAGRSSRREDMRRVDRPRRVPARLRERVSDDDAARRERRAGVHAGARRGALRNPAGADPRFHRAQGRHLRQHPWRSRHRRQDGRAADRAVRLAGRRVRARRRALARQAQEPDRARGRRAHLQGARDDAARPRARLRPGRARARTARPLAAARDLPPLRVPGAAEPHRHARRGRPSSRASRCRHECLLGDGRRIAEARRSDIRCSRRRPRCGRPC